MAHACNSNTWETENKGLEFRPQISLGYLVSGTLYEKKYEEGEHRKEGRKEGREEGRERKDGGRFGEQVF